jgi:hypothetical protein
MDVVDHMRVEMRMVLAAYWVAKVLVNRVAAGLGVDEAKQGEQQEGRLGDAGARSDRVTRERESRAGPPLFVVLHHLRRPLSLMRTLLEAIAADEQLHGPADDVVLRQLNKMCDAMAAAMLLGLVVGYPLGRSRAYRDEGDETLFEALDRAEVVLNRATSRLPYREKDLLSTLQSYRWNLRRTARALVIHESAVRVLCSTTLQNLGAALREELGVPP